MFCKPERTFSAASRGVSTALRFSLFLRGDVCRGQPCFLASVWSASDLNPGGSKKPAAQVDNLNVGARLNDKPVLVSHFRFQRAVTSAALRHEVEIQKRLLRRSNRAGCDNPPFLGNSCGCL